MQAVPLIRVDPKTRAMAQARERCPNNTLTEQKRMAWYLLKFTEGEYAVLGNRFHEVCSEYRAAAESIEGECNVHQSAG